VSAEPMPLPRRVAAYERVSSEDQRERETIKTQTEELARRLEREPDVQLVERYADDGVSGTIPLAERPAGGRLMRDAARGRFTELWVYKLDRLGRDAVDLLVVRRRFLELGIRVISVVEAEPDLLSYDVQAVVADHARREFLRRSADGLNRAAREGRYCGGMVSYGYRVQGGRQLARFVPDDTVVAAGLTAADVVRLAYRRVGLEGWSCRRVAEELNALGVPPHYARDGRGVRGRRTCGVWRAGRIRNLLVEPIYMGIRKHGRRSGKPDREVIIAAVEPLVSLELWQGAQDGLARNRICAKNTPVRYLLRGVITCGECGLRFVASHGRDAVVWYRCNGRMRDRGPLEGRCRNRSLNADWLEPLIWADIERWLRDPGDLLEELDDDRERGTAAAVALAESLTIQQALAHLDAERAQAQRLAMRGSLTDEELDRELERIEGSRAGLEGRLAALLPSPVVDPVPTETVDLLAKLRQRLDVGLSEVERQHIVELLVSVRVTQETSDGELPRTRVAVRYQFPGAVETRTRTGSSPPQAAPPPGTAARPAPERSPHSPPPMAGEGPPGHRDRTPPVRPGRALPCGPGSPRRARAWGLRLRARDRTPYGAGPGTDVCAAARRRDRAGRQRTRSPSPRGPRPHRAAAGDRESSARATSCRHPAGRPEGGCGPPRGTPREPSGRQPVRARRRGRRVFRRASAARPEGHRGRGCPTPPRAPPRRSVWTMGSTPVTGCTSPVSESSPSRAQSPPDATTWPDATRIPTAIATSYAAPCLRRPAGARLMVMRSRG